MRFNIIILLLFNVLRLYKRLGSVNFSLCSNKSMLKKIQLQSKVFLNFITVVTSTLLGYMLESLFAKGCIFFQFKDYKISI